MEIDRRMLKNAENEYDANNKAASKEKEVSVPVERRPPKNAGKGWRLLLFGGRLARCICFDVAGKGKTSKGPARGFSKGSFGRNSWGKGASKGYGKRKATSDPYFVEEPKAQRR